MPLTPYTATETPPQEKVLALKPKPLAWTSRVWRESPGRAVPLFKIDVRIEPIVNARAFWQARVDAQPDDGLSRTKLASTILAEARETGDLTLYPVAETELRSVLTVSPTLRTR